MQTLSKEHKLLKELYSCIQEYFQNSHRREAANLSDIYNYIRKKESFKSVFSESKDFSRFMRKMYHEEVLFQFIPNCSVDTTIFHHYKWKFYPRDTILKKQTHLLTDKTSDKEVGKPKIFPQNLKYIASNGVEVRSQQELYIIEQLLLIDFFKTIYEEPLSGNYHEKYPDFTITNTDTGKKYYWEHFGLLDSNGKYFDKTLEKLVWYRTIGIINIDEGGNLIVTQYRDDIQFGYLVEKYIQKIKEDQT